MRRLAFCFLLSALVGLTPGVWAGAEVGESIYVDCGVAPGGDGSQDDTISTITSATAIARSRGGSDQAHIVVAKSVCDQETLPIVLDVPVRLLGSPVGTTLVTTTSVDASATFFAITADNVEIRQISLDGRLPLGPDSVSIAPSGPFGVSAVGVDGLVLRYLRIEGMGQAVRIEASNGRLSDSYLSARSGVFLSGGSGGTVPTAEVRDNQIVYRINGIAVAGAGAFGSALRALIEGNDVRTVFTNTGPTNPAAFRASPIVGAAPAGALELEVKNNVFGGPAKYGIMLHGGMPSRGRSYTGEIDARFDDNQIDSAVVRPVLVTFTNAKATVFPCELNPTIPAAECPSLQFASGQAVYWEYLTNARFALRHDGELDGALVDHPQFHPFDGYLLGNRLVVNQEPVPYQSFLIVPGTAGFGSQ